MSWKIYQKKYNPVYSKINFGKEDCAINVLELLKFIDKKTADIMRIIRGDDPITNFEMIEIFELLTNKKFRIEVERNKLKNVKTFKSKLQKIKPHHAVVGFVARDDDSGHIFVIMRNKKDLFIVDPHQYSYKNNYTEKCHDSCNDYFVKLMEDKKSKFGLVEYK